MSLSARYQTLYREVLASYTVDKARDEAAHDVMGYYLYRRLSFPLTPLFMMLGLSANAVTTLGLVCSCLQPVVAWAFAPKLAASVVVGLGVSVQILDCVDGNIARTRQAASSVGSMLDSLGTLFFWISTL